MTKTVKIHQSPTETHLPGFEQAARARRSAKITPANLPGTRQPFRHRANVPTIRQTAAPAPKKA